MNPILIADPDPAARKALTLILKHRFGVEQIREAGDVETLIRFLANCPPELLLLDWTLYGAPAPETCRLLRKAYPMLKIILLSADANDVTAANETKAAFIHKGAAPEQLIATLTPVFADSEHGKE
jgi:DNA-binding NarL/FixJ family response regulator